MRAFQAIRGQRGSRPALRLRPLVWAAGGVMCACVFRPPPALPEEVAAQKAAEDALNPASAGGAAGGAGEAGASEGAGGGAGFAKGDEPGLGMSPEEMKAYATAQGDPVQGEFSLETALEGLPAGGPLWAVIKTPAGNIECELFEMQAPVTVANFVGLARGRRPAQNPESGAWETKPYYDGVEFHRAIPGFMVQGGDPSGTGRGNTGYVIQDEFVPDLSHDRPGRLSMANRGPGTGSAQFFVTLGPTTHLDGKHTIFGQCLPASVDVAETIAGTAGPDSRPVPPQTMQTVVIERR